MTLHQKIQLCYGNIQSIVALKEDIHVTCSIIAGGSPNLCIVCGWSEHLFTRVFDLKLFVFVKNEGQNFEYDGDPVGSLCLGNPRVPLHSL